MVDDVLREVAGVSERVGDFCVGAPARVDPVADPALWLCGAEAAHQFSCVGGGQVSDVVAAAQAHERVLTGTPRRWQAGASMMSRSGTRDVCSAMRSPARDVRCAVSDSYVAGGRRDDPEKSVATVLLLLW
jgi:hypothetical protein